MNRLRALRFPALIVFGIYALYSCVLVPLLQIIYANTVYRATIWYDIVDLLFNYFEIFGMATIFGFLIYAVAHRGVKACRSYYLLFGGALLFKYAAAIVAAWIVGGSIDLTYDYSGYLVALLLEVTECVFAVLLTHALTTRYQDAATAQKRAARTLGVDAKATDPYLPFHAWLSRINPVQRAAFWSMMLVLGIRWITYIVSDIAYMLMGAIYTWADLPISILYWIVLIVIPCALGYLLSLLCMRLAHRDAEE